MTIHFVVQLALRKMNPTKTFHVNVACRATVKKLWDRKVLSDSRSNTIVDLWKESYRPETNATRIIFFKNGIYTRYKESCKSRAIGLHFILDIVLWVITFLIITTRINIIIHVKIGTSVVLIKYIEIRDYSFYVCSKYIDKLNGNNRVCWFTLIQLHRCNRGTGNLG